MAACRCRSSSKGCRSYRRIYWRVVAANAAGIRRSGRTSFLTARAPSSVTLSVFPPLTTWSRTVSISGRVLGAGVGGIVVALEQSAFPYAAGFHQVATARTNGAGEFRFAALPVFLATRFRAVPQIAPRRGRARCSETRVRSRVAVRAAAQDAPLGAARGHVNPGLPDGRATLQRRTRSGRLDGRSRGARCAPRTTCARPTASRSGERAERGATA